MSTDDTTFALLRELIEAQPDKWPTRAHLAVLLLQADRAAEALELVDAAPQRPQDEAGMLLLGRVLAAADASRAIAHYRAMVEADRRCAAAHLALAHLYRDRGIREDARHHYGIAVVIDEALEDAAFDDWIHGSTSAPTSSASDAPAAPRSPRIAAPPRAAGGAAGDDPSDVPPDAPHDGSDDAPTADDLQRVLDIDGKPAPRMPKLTFDDVGGMEDLKEQIRMRVVYPFRNPEVFKRFKKKAGGGILLYGPPGCGKTHLARATAGECDARFVNIGISDVLSKWIGESEQRLASIFNEARRRAPTVIFIDELDALGMTRTQVRGAALQTTINQLLTELDGATSANEGVLVLAATNAPWSVDPAFRRPGRFDRVVFVPPPDREARAAILGLHLADIPHEAVDLKRLAAATRRFSGADLAGAVERAAEMAIHEQLRTGKPAEIGAKSLRRALKAASASTLEWLETARGYASYANTAGQYDDVAQYLEADPD